MIVRETQYECDQQNEKLLPYQSEQSSTFITEKMVETRKRCAPKATAVDVAVNCINYRVI